MRTLSFFLLFLISACTSYQVDRMTATELIAELEAIETTESATEKMEQAEQLWAALLAAEAVPFTSDSTVIFLYRGDVNSVHWNGDFNSWGGNQAIQVSGERVSGTDLWYARKKFPADARLDYKITLDETDWILDPNNPHQQWSGFGPNSELRMPEWKPEPLTERIPNSETDIGTFTEPKIIESKELGYEVAYQVYLPNGYETMNALNVIYATDGQEYSSDELGAMVIVLDNLHYLNKIEPTMAVFVSPLDPENEELNRRMDEMGNNESYLKFFTDELIPQVERTYPVRANADSRAILGTSLGGLNATYFGFSRPDLFGNIAIQAPAYWYREEIYDLVKENTVNNPEIYLSVGTVNDNTMDARLMHTIFKEKNLLVHYLEVHQGHSWGAWRTQIDDILIQFFGS